MCFFNKVCERSLSGSGAGPNATSAAQFAKAEMLPSGYLIRPCDGGCSIIHIVDHINFEVRKIIAKIIIPLYTFLNIQLKELILIHWFLQGWSVPDVLRPLYESSKVVAQRMTIAVSVDMTQAPLRRVSLFCQITICFYFVF